MTAEEFTLQPSVPPDPHMLDGEVATHDWPLPAARPWAPAPSPSLFWQIVEALT